MFHCGWFEKLATSEWFTSMVKVWLAVVATTLPLSVQFTK